MKKNKKSTGSEEESFPGYPRYPASEDIVNRAKRVEMELDGDEKSPLESMSDPVADNTASPTAAPKPKRRAKSPSDVTPDDLQALDAEENNFEGDDAVLGDRAHPVDFAGKDLDVPGSELDDRDELRGDEDEENNLYSLGGENHEDLEEDRS